MLLIALAVVASASLQNGFQQAERALADGRLADAEQAFRELARQAPEVAEIHGRLGLVYFEEKRFSEAVPELRRALKLKPSLPNTDLLLGMSLAETGQAGEALPLLDKGFHRAATDPTLKRISGLHLARVYTELRRDTEAVQVTLELNKLFPNDPEILYQSGRLFGNYAYLSMRKLAEVAPDSVWRHEAAADAYFSSANYDLAVSEYRAALEKQNDRPGLHYRLGRALLATSSRADAAQEFERELELDASNANAAYELAEMHRKAGDFQKAAQLFQAALRYYPEFEEANVGLGRALLALNQPADAVAALKKATALNAADPVAFYQLSLAYKALHQPEEQTAALARFQQLKSRAPAVELLKPDAGVTKQEIQ